MKHSRRAFLKTSATIAAGGASAAGIPLLAGGEAAPAGDHAEEFRVHPVGRVEIQGKVHRIRILEPYADALLGLGEWSHVNVLYWFDRNDTPVKRRILRVHPRGDAKNPLTGVFACRSPVRPNLIALTTCKIASVEGPVVTVESIDALDGTPVLDLKPLIPPDFSVKDLRVPKWADGK